MCERQKAASLVPLAAVVCWWRESDECQVGEEEEREIVGHRIMDKRPQSQTQTLPEVRSA